MDPDLRWSAARIALAEKLYDWGVVEFKYTKLKLHEQNPDAPLSPIYLNLRTPDNPKPGPLTPERVEEIARYFFWRSRMLKIPCDFVAGIPRAGDPFAWEYCRIYNTAFPYPIHQLRLIKEETASGRRISSVETQLGNFRKGGDVLLLDDLVTRADSKLEAIGVLESRSFTVRHILVVIDRSQGGQAGLKKKGFSLHSIFHLSWLIEHYWKARAIDQAKYEEVKAYLQANAT